MIKGIACGALALATMLFCFNFGVEAQQLPAVSGANGKLEFGAGALTLPTPAFLGRAAGTLTLPIGERFGVQADFSLSTASGFAGSTALHVFTRDPASYLIGGTLGYVRTPGADVVAAGPETELYLGQWTLEAWGGVAQTVPTAPSSPEHMGVFGMAGLSYYPTGDLRLSLDLFSLDGYNAIQFGGEYLLRNFRLPMSVTGTAHVGQDGATRLMLGLRGYFGPDPDKSLIRRHREDDPSDRAVGLLMAVEATRYQATTGGASQADDGGSQSNPPGAQKPDWCISYYAWDGSICTDQIGNVVGPPSI